GGGASNGITFSVVAPTISGLVPSSTPYCGATGFTLIVNGTNFVDGLVVNWNGSPRPTTFVSATQQLTALISATDTAFSGTAAITVSSSTTTSASSNFMLTVPGSLPVPNIT